jgi:hypothetical protein
MSKTETALERPVSEAGEILFDHALEAAGMPPRDDNESLLDYVIRKAWGPNTIRNLRTAIEAAAVLNRDQIYASIQSARQHHDDPNPPDSNRLKP